MGETGHPKPTHPSPADGKSPAAAAAAMHALQFNAKPLIDRVRSAAWLPALPTRDRFMADLTLGLTDGLTVPFALTAGLSSLGDTQMVISAGLAELAAGSISMSLGGYLAAKETVAAVASHENEKDGAEAGGAGSYTRLLDNGDASDVESCLEEKPHTETSQPVALATQRYLAPLDLPPELQRLVFAHMNERPDVQTILHEKEQDLVSDSDKGEQVQQITASPVVSGLSIGLGYLAGGLVPLLPYFFTGDVSGALKTSFAVCVLALFTFGFVRAYLSNSEVGAAKLTTNLVTSAQRRVLRLRRSIWEGVIMAGLGMAAALAAVVCVRLAPDVAGSSQ